MGLLAMSSHADPAGPALLPFPLGKELWLLAGMMCYFDLEGCTGSQRLACMNIESIVAIRKPKPAAWRIVVRSPDTLCSLLQWTIADGHHAQGILKGLRIACRRAAMASDGGWLSDYKCCRRQVCSQFRWHRHRAGIASAERCWGDESFDLRHGFLIRRPESFDPGAYVRIPARSIATIDSSTRRPARAVSFATGVRGVPQHR